MSAGYRLVIRAPGGPEAIEREDFDALPEPGPGQVRIRNTAIGLNFIDIYHRTGLYPLTYPAGLGRETAGVVDALGAAVEDFALDDRVGSLFASDGAYATHSIVNAVTLFPIPAAISDEIAAAAMLKGLTTWMIVEKCARVLSGQTVLVHAAAGGVGSIAVQWLKALGAIVIAHAGSPEKAAVAKGLGADHVLDGSFGTLAAQVRELTDGRGVDAVLDGVGKASWEASIASLARRGMMVSYGNASGAVGPFAPLLLAQSGSLFLTRPTLFDYLAAPAERSEGGAKLFEMIADGAIRIEIGQRFALADAADAHRALEARQTTGSTVLVP